MIDNRVQRALEIVAEKDNTTVEEVRSDIQAFLREVSAEELIAIVAHIFAENSTNERSPVA